MKKLPLIAIILTSINCYPQNDCENFATITASYVVPKSIALGIDYFTEIGLTVGAGGAYTTPKRYSLKQGENVYDSIGNSLDIFTYVGYRIYRTDYTLSIFTNVGITMGDQEKLQPFTSIKFLFPIDQKAISIEPIYIFGRGITGKISAHFKL